jgi:AcrR family transcriptional regulator
MAAENMDRRVRKTRTMLRLCLARLLKEKKIQEISVKEISEMADINRGTFYLH